jgi:hypothetical protein
MLKKLGKYFLLDISNKESYMYLIIIFKDGTIKKYESIERIWHLRNSAYIEFAGTIERINKDDIDVIEVRY